MLELPEAAVIADRLNASVIGKRIDRVEAGKSRHKWAWFHGDPADYPNRLGGRTISGIRSWGGVVDVGAEDVDLYFGDGVNLRLIPAGGAVPAKHQLRLDLDDGSVLVASVQMYGGLWACPSGEMPNSFLAAAREKPSPFTEEFSRDYFESLLSGVAFSASAKAFLATEQRIPGLGNGVLQDILFAARIHPKRKLSSMGEGEVSALFDSCRVTLTAMYRAGGRDTEKLLDGKPGGYVTILSRNTAGQPCPVCAAPIEKAAYMGGSVYYCPDCQVT